MPFKFYNILFSIKEILFKPENPENIIELLRMNANAEYL